MSARAAVYLLKGDEATVTVDALRALVGELVGDADPSLVVEELAGEEYSLAAVVDAAQTPPFLTDRRVVVARDVGRFSTAEVGPLVAYLASPLPTTSLVLVGGGGQTPRSLVDAVRKAGTVVDAGVGRGRSRSDWLATQIAQGPVRLNPLAAALVGEHLGEDVGRLGSLLNKLAAVYGAGTLLTPAEVGPLLGQAGAVAPWDLTDALDAGDTARALSLLKRALAAGSHPLQVLATLHSHYVKALRLDGDPSARDEASAAAALGITSGSTFPARKALANARRLGHAGVARAIGLLGEADLHLKGMIDWPPEVVMEVLVGRLSRLGARTGARR